MTMRITMTQTRYGEAGTLLNAGSTYTVSDAVGAAMVGAKFATDTDAVLTPAATNNLVSYNVNPLTGVGTLSAGGVALAGVGGVRRRDTPLRVATFGDSTANIGATSSPDNLDMSVVTAPFPVSGATSVGFVSIEKCLLQMVYPQAYIVANCGVSGDATSLMLTRDSAAASTTRKATTDVIDSRPDVIVYRGASINNLVNVTPANWQSVADTTFAEHVQVLNRLLAAGVPVLDNGVYGYGDGASATGANPDSVRLALQYLNGKISDYITALASSRVVYINPVGVVQADDGRYITGMTTDGVHLNFMGQYLMSSKEAAALVAIFGEPKSQRYPGPNLIANSMFASVGATGYGVLATGVTQTLAGGTMTAGSIQMVDGKPYQVFEYTITGASNLAVNMPCPVTTAGIVANDVYGFEYDYFVEGVDGTVPVITTLYGRVDLFKTGAGRVIDACFAAQYGAWPAGGIKGKQAFPPIKIQEASAALSASSVMNLIIGLSNTSGKMRVGVAQPRMVKL